MGESVFVQSAPSLLFGQRAGFLGGSGEWNI